MSIDTHMLLRTPLSAEQVRAALLHDPALADLGLADLGTGTVSGKLITMIVKPWQEDDCDLIENGFKTATVRAKLFPRGGTEAGWDALYRAIAAIMRLVPGDVCLASQDSAGPDLLRLGGVV